MATDHAELRETIDRLGANLAAWHDRELAKRVRAAALADRALRAYLEGALALEDGLRAARDALDSEIEESRAADRISAAVLARLAADARPRRRLRWIAVAAALVLSAGLGSIVETRLLAASEQATQDVVVLDPIVFGTNAAGM